MAGDALEPAVSGDQIFLVREKNKCLCVVCSMEMVSDFIFFKLYLKWYTITFLGRNLVLAFSPLCLARVYRRAASAGGQDTLLVEERTGDPARSCSPSPT